MNDIQLNNNVIELIEIVINFLAVVAPVALTTIGVSLLGRATWSSVAGFLGKFVAVVRQYMDDPKDAIIKKIAKELGLPPEYVAAQFNVLWDRLEKEAPPLAESGNK